jgi:hypothetical protein
MTGADARLYGRWILANGWAEALGLGTTLLLGRAAAPLLDRTTGIAVTLFGALAAVVLGVVLEGTLVGAIQARVLRQALPDLAPQSWVSATMLGAGIAWILGMVPSTVAALTTAPGLPVPPTEPSALLQYGLAAGLGLVTGPILGAAQFRVLRRYVSKAHWWLWANAGAWALGMMLIFVGMDVVPWERGAVPVAASVYAVCGLAGLAVGMVHGRMLLWLLKSPLRTGAAA